jgi:hypothetical protein
MDAAEFNQPTASFSKHNTTPIIRPNVTFCDRCLALGTYLKSSATVARDQRSLNDACTSISRYDAVAEAINDVAPPDDRACGRLDDYLRVCAATNCVLINEPTTILQA